MFYRLTLRARLTLAFCCLAAMVAAVSAMALSDLGDANHRFNHFVNGIDKRALLVARVRTAVEERAIAARNLVLVTEVDDIQKEKAQVLAAHAEVEASLTELRSQMAAAKDAPLPAHQMVDEIARVEAAYGPVAMAIVDAALQGHREAAIAQMNSECRPLLARLIQATDAYAKFTADRARGITDDSESEHDHARAMLLAACLTTLAIALAFGVLITPYIKAALGAEPSGLASAAQRIAQGDLADVDGAAHASPKSVLASLSTMQRNLAAIVGGVRAPPSRSQQARRRSRRATRT